MKLQPDTSNGFIINAYGSGWIEVNGQRFTQSLIVSSLHNTVPAPWQPECFEKLVEKDLASLLLRGSELVIFGSGLRLRFAKPQWFQGFMAMGIGVETMDTAAACRTYNILVSEGRKVTAGLILES